MNFIFIVLQYLLPQILLSKLAGYLSNCKINFIKNFLILTFIRIYQVNLQEAIRSEPHAYKTFNDFFTRKLKENARIINMQNTIVSPVDGILYQFGDIKQDQLFQAKNYYFNVIDLLGGDTQLAEFFRNKKFLSAYLAPRNYHRVHMPVTGKLLKMIYVPGRLFSVNPLTVKNIPRLFSRNERVICVFETALGKMAVILIGAMLVGSIYTQWNGKVNKTRKIQCWDYSDNEILLNKGDELGFFEMGSTVILLFQNDQIRWVLDLFIDTELRVGQGIAN